MRVGPALVSEKWEGAVPSTQAAMVQSGAL